jgi:hypothetical protein
VTLGVGDDLDRRCEVDELHALALGLGELLLVDDHLVAAAAVDDVDLFRAEPPRRRRAVHRGVTTAEHHDPLPHLDRPAAVCALEEHDARHDAGGILAGDAGVVRLEAAGRDEDRVVRVVELAERYILAHERRQAQLDVLVDDAVDVAVDDLAWQAEWRHARERRPTRLVQRVVDRDPKPELAEIARRGEAGAARTDDRHLPTRRSEHRRRRLGVRMSIDADVLVAPVREELLHVADRERLVDLFAAARGLARGGADRSADRRHRVRIERELPGLLEFACRGEVQVSPAVGLHRTGFLARDVVLIPAGTDLYDLVQLSHRAIRHATGA